MDQQLKFFKSKNPQAIMDHRLRHNNQKKPFFIISEAKEATFHTVQYSLHQTPKVSRNTEIEIYNSYTTYG